MTVVAWDGHTLAADKMACSGEYNYRVEKMHKTEGGELLFFAGDFSSGLALVDWYIKGADVEKYPSFQNDKDDWCALHVIRTDGTLWKYEKRPYPFQIFEKNFAAGSGREFAVGAMAMGADSERAVQIAIDHSPCCGMGIDTLVLGN